MFFMINIQAMTEEQKPADQSSSGPSSAGKRQKFVPKKFTEEFLIDVYFKCVDDKEGKLADQHVQEFKALNPKIQNRQVIMPLFVQAIYDELDYVLPVLFKAFPDIKYIFNNDGLNIAHFICMDGTSFCRRKNKTIYDLCIKNGVQTDETNATFKRGVALAKEKVHMHASSKSTIWDREAVKDSLKTVLMHEKWTNNQGAKVDMDELRQRMEDSLAWHKQHQQERQDRQGAQDDDNHEGDDDVQDDAQATGTEGLAAKFGQLCTVL